MRKFDLLYETFLGWYDNSATFGKSSSNKYELSSNEELDNLPDSCRGIILRNGDLITLVNAYSKADYHQEIIHYSLADAYFKVKNVNEFLDMYKDLSKCIFVIRDISTNNFYLGESYNNETLTSKDKLGNTILRKQYSRNFKIKNPAKNLIFETYSG